MAVAFFLSIKSGREFEIGSSFSLKAIISLIPTFTLCDVKADPSGRFTGAPSDSAAALAFCDCRESFICFYGTIPRA